MRGAWLPVVTMLAASCAPNVDRPQVSLEPRSRSVVNDGHRLAVDVVNDGGAGLVTLSASLGVIAPASFGLGAQAQTTVSFSCDWATNEGCLGQSVLTADVVDAQGSHWFASTVVQVVEPAPGFVPSLDGGCDASQLLGPATTCCWSPAVSTTAPQCGWVGQPGNVDFAVSVGPPDGGSVSSARFDFRVPAHFRDPSNCAQFHPGFSATVAGAALTLSCAGYGVDFVSGAWSPLAFGTCQAGDDFFASAVCPRLGSFAAAAFALEVPFGDAGVTVFTVIPR
jgi:hypothetical protein